MATGFLSTNRGTADTSNNVTVGTSAPTADFYFAIDLATHSPTKKDAIKALRKFERYILDNGLPAGETGVDLPVL